MRRAHRALGFVRLDDYSRERLGLSGREVQELARVAARLEQLPRLAAAFDAGQLSWTHVRLLATAATPETEAEWIVRTRGRTVRALTAAIGEDDGETVDGEAAARFHLRCPRRVLRVWSHVTELASRMSGARLPAWRAAEAIAAEGMSGAEVVVPPRDAVRARSEPAHTGGHISWEAFGGGDPRRPRASRA